MSHARRFPHSSIRQPSVSSVAIRWPVCHTPPRVVIHRIWVEKPSSATSHTRSHGRCTPIRPSSHQPIPTVDAARIALTPDSISSAVTGPVIATSGMSAIAGNGANGT